MESTTMVGKFISWTSNSGNRYDGRIDKVRQTPKGTLLTVDIGHDDFYHPQYRSLYVDPSVMKVVNYVEGPYCVWNN